MRTGGVSGRLPSSSTMASTRANGPVHPGPAADADAAASRRRPDRDPGDAVPEPRADDADARRSASA